MKVLTPSTSLQIIGLLTLIVMLAPSLSHAQKLELSLTPGYLFAGSINGSAGNIDVKSDFGYNGALSYRLRRGNMLEFSYTTQGSEVVIQQHGRRDYQEEIDLRTEYFLVSFLKSPRSPRAVVQPFGGFSAGVVVFSPDHRVYDTVVRMATGLNGGVRIYPSERIGFRFSGRLLFPVTINSAALWCSGSGCNIGASAKTYLVQGDLQAGITYRFGK